MIYWAPFLHFYQPPTQFHAILKKVCNESYRPLLKMLSEHRHAKVTVNICGVLTEMLNDHGFADVIDSLKDLASNEQLEFVDSAKYHAILPLIPQREASRQIELNHKVNKFFFKDTYKPRGFFPPEMCYSSKVANILGKMGYEWVILSGIANSQDWPLSEIQEIMTPTSNLKIFYRDDVLSNKISFHSIDSAGFISELVNLSKGKKDIYVITAMDAETFGHHIQNWEHLFLAEVYEMIEGISRHKDLKQRTDLAEDHKKLIEESLKSSQLTPITVSELIDKFPTKFAKPPKSSSWSTSKDDIVRKNYYPLWQGIGNHVHTLQWEHIKICFELMGEAYKLKDNEQSNCFYDIARGLLDRAIHSCQFWWANRNGMWDINLINKGLMLQEEVIVNAFKAINVTSAREEVKGKFYREVVAARDISNKIRDQLFLN